LGRLNVGLDRCDARAGAHGEIYAWLGGGASLLATYVALTAVLSIAAGALDADIKRFAMAFSAAF